MGHQDAGSPTPWRLGRAFRFGTGPSKGREAKRVLEAPEGKRWVTSNEGAEGPEESKGAADCACCSGSGACIIGVRLDRSEGREKLSPTGSWQLGDLDFGHQIGYSDTVWM